MVILKMAIGKEKEFLNGMMEKKYDGEWKNNLFYGKETYYYKSGDKYEGDWVLDKRRGKGIMYYNEKDNYNRKKFEGDFVNVLFEGKSILEWKDGDKYDGEFKNNQELIILKIVPFIKDHFRMEKEMEKVNINLLMGIII